MDAMAAQADLAHWQPQPGFSSAGHPINQAKRIIPYAIPGLSLLSP